ncbi:MAG: flagellar biosynthetic protein FliR [Vampirovibrionales bacterium]|nr:flagellar biosynthetic protein FliR [Vampirovibrionales bacterium]
MQITEPVLDILTWFNPTVIVGFVLVLSRISGLLVAGPLFAESTMPLSVKVAIAFGFSILVYMLVAFVPDGHTVGNLPQIHDLWQFATVAFCELALGAFLGFGLNLVFYAVRGAGELMALQMGLNAAGLIDPLTRLQNTAVGELLFLLALVLFLLADVHHHMIGLLLRTYQHMPLGFILLKNTPVMSLMDVVKMSIFLTGGTMVLALSLAMPILGAMLVTEIGLSFVTKVLPQMNVFVVGIPLKIAIGFLVMMSATPAFAQALLSAFDLSMSHLLRAF